jgi:hypothetical protein
MSTKTTILTLPKEDCASGQPGLHRCGLSIAYRIGVKAWGPTPSWWCPPAASPYCRGCSPSVHQAAGVERHFRLHGHRRYRGSERSQGAGS